MSSFGDEPFVKTRPKGGGAVVGRVNREGELTGYRFAYIYPGICGLFVNDVILLLTEQSSGLLYSNEKRPLFLFKLDDSNTDK